jgi:acyl-CoA synthetase (NDP forming)
VAVRLAPLTRRDAAEMLRELRTFPVLKGYRGSPPADVASLEDLLLRVSALAEDLPQVVEMDLNPVRVGERGVWVLDARVRVELVQPTPRVARR